MPVTLSVAIVLWWLCYDARRCTDSELASDEMREAVRRHHDVSAAVMELACNYDPETCESLRRFRPVVKGSRCLFAKDARLWGSRDWDASQSIEANVRASVPTLLQMLLRGESEGIDGFVFEVRCQREKGGPCGVLPSFATDVYAFAEVVRRVLCEISDCDPSGERSARKSYVSDRAWHFVFARHPLFVTTFAPCYGPTSSRFAHGAASGKSCFVLLQPEYSFLIHDLPADTPHTNWEAPENIRDRIRISFKRAGQAYAIPSTVHYPPAEHIVKPLEEGLAVIEWWKKGDGGVRSSL